MNRATPQLIVSVALIALFAFAYFKNSDDDMFKGALIAAFVAAYGYWLGSSSGSKSSGDVVRRIAEQPTVTAIGDRNEIHAPAPHAEPSADDTPPGDLPPWERDR